MTAATLGQSSVTRPTDCCLAQKIFRRAEEVAQFLSEPIRPGPPRYDVSRPNFSAKAGVEQDSARITNAVEVEREA